MIGSNRSHKEYLLIAKKIINSEKVRLANTDISTLQKIKALGQETKWSWAQREKLVLELEGKLEYKPRKKKDDGLGSL